MLSEDSIEITPEFLGWYSVHCKTFTAKLLQNKIFWVVLRLKFVMLTN